jgi:hypothetical protein
MANILILHATVGTGHKSAAMALEKSLKRAGAERVWVQDTLEYGAEWFRRLYADSWIDLVEKASPIWGMAYHESARADDRRLTRDLRKLYSKLGVNRMPSSAPISCPLMSGSSISATKGCGRRSTVSSPITWGTHTGRTRRWQAPLWATNWRATCF